MSDETDPKKSIADLITNPWALIATLIVGGGVGSGVTGVSLITKPADIAAEVVRTETFQQMKTDIAEITVQLKAYDRRIENCEIVGEKHDERLRIIEIEIARRHGSTVFNRRANDE